MQCAAPRDSASMPSAPLPAYRSATTAPSITPALPSELKIASRTLSVVGRVVVPPGGDQPAPTELSRHDSHRAAGYER